MNFSEKDIARLASFPEQNPNPVIEVNTNTGEITYMNPSCKFRFPELILKHSDHILFAEIKKKITTKKDFQCEVVVGESIFEQKIFFIPESDLIRIYSTDITERTLIQKNLSRLATFPEQNPSPIIEVDLQKNITYLNAASNIHFPDIQFLQFSHPVLESLRNNFGKFLSGELLNYESEIKIGEKYYTQRKRIMQDAGVIRMFNIDITDMKRAEEIIKEKNKDITDSINYAKKIQESILPPIEILKNRYKNSFVLYQPKDIVSGDFYWFNLAGSDTSTNTNYAELPYLIIAAADCTGHGVPGALMSMIGSNLLGHIVMDREINSPDEALTELDKRIKKALKQETEDNESKDGMDIALCAIHKEKSILHYAGANRPIIIIRNGEILEYVPNKFPIGGMHISTKVFNAYKIDLIKGDCIYMFTYGFCDQFGGPKGKKFMKKQLLEILTNIHTLDMPEQHKILSEKFNSWKGEMEQTDDVLVIGIKHE